MRKDTRRLFVSLGILFIAWTAAGWMNNTPVRKKKKSDFIFPTTQVRYFTFGFNELFSDSYWLRVIQDFDVCVYPKAPPDAPRTGLNRTPHCELDWAYHMLDVVTELTPRNYIPYAAGGTMLSVVLDDIKGATLIYEKGLARFPTDWQINFQAATHLMTEVGDFTQAAYYYNRAVEHGAPGWVAALSAKLYDRVGRTELALANLKAQLKRAPDEKFVEPIQKKIYELEMKLRAEREKKQKVDKNQ